MTGAGSTLARLERVLLIVPWLLEHPGALIEETEERFGVSREELLADLDLLGYTGLPGYGGGDLVQVSVVGDRIDVRLADFFRRPLNLSLREALPLLLSARALAGVSAVAQPAALARAIAKLEAALGGETAPVAIDLHSPGDEHMGALRGALEDRHVVHLTYRSADGRTRERDVEPWALTAHGGAWYLQGFCRLAGAPRDFRLDRVAAMAVTDEPAGEPGTPAPPVYRPAADDPSVVLALEPSAAWVAEWAVVDHVETVAGRTVVRLRTAGLDWAARLVLGLGGAAVALEPAALRARIAALAREARSAHSARM